ncbi:nucleoside phosphorylase domain-containing protein [Mariannaea sp. PMI_226]|nr:nucleoside phosphorylase domain-containing protein [Mariannaea sp. PMI_226]
MEPDENEVETTRNPKRRSRSDSDSDNGTSTLSSGNLKRQKQDHEKNSEYDKVADHARTREGTSFHNYGVGWICALPHELAAARAMLDSTHENLFQIEGDINTYTLGNIGSHNVVMACLPQKGTGMNNAAIVATHLLRSFGKIYLMLMVGIGGGIPGPHDPRLGDVVVGSEVIQYDLGKSIKDGQFQRTGILRLSNTHVRTALSKFMAEHDTHQNEIPKILRRIVERDRKMTPYATQGWAADLLFRSDCEHSSLINCESCDKLKLVPRTPRTGEQPHIHYGKIASANRVVKDATERDKLSRDLGALCIDMEAAGIMDSYPSLLSIRGLSDYSDAHKNDEWQKYAAGTAAACAKEFLSVMPCKRGLGSSPTAEGNNYI